MTTISSEETLISIIFSNLPKFILPLAGVFLLFFVMREINIDRERRERQVIVPYIAMGYCVLTVILGTIFFQKVNTAKIYGIFRVIVNAILSKSGFKPIVPPYSGGFIIFVNIVFLFVFLTLKLIICRFIEWLADKNHLLFTEIASVFYGYDTAFARWFLREYWRGFQRLFEVLAWISAFLCGLLLGISWVYEFKTRVAFIIFPYVLVIICNEISEALNGYTKAEYENSIGGDDSVIAGKIGNFQLILDIYEKLLRPNLLASQRGNDFAPKQGVTDYIEELCKSDNQVDQLAGHFFNQQIAEGVSLDIDSMQGSVSLLHNNSVIFANPFYRDLSKYVLLPVVDSLIKGKKCLFLIGEKDIAEDVTVWANEMLEAYAKVSGIWRSSVLNQDEPDCEVGILDFSSLYDIDVQAANQNFFRNVSVCILVECSNMISTVQISLGIVVKELFHQEHSPVYCVIDRNADGLVDTFSHVLQTSITDVVATPIPHCAYTSAIWDASGDYQRQKWFKKETRFLGNVMELAAIAIKNQIPKVTIIGGKALPTKDIEWIAGQYYPQIADYTHLLKQQASIKQRFIFESNLWNLEKKREQFLIVEDQYCNMFETLRLFLSRGEQQAFINVMSGSYLLRDYMHYNRHIFMADAKAVPTIIPDFARTERNYILQLIMRMAFDKIPEHVIAEELTLLNIPQGNDTSVSKEIENLIGRYTAISGRDVVLSESRAVDPDSPISEMETFYFIGRDTYEKCFKSTLSNAYFVTEDQRMSSEYIDAKMYGMITQCILPGQFLVSAGKYYQVESVNPEYGVLLRRASDRYQKRTEYRQLRRYVFEPSKDYIPISSRKMMDIEFSFEQRNFRVVTEGYLDMKAYHDLRSARVIDFSSDSIASELSDMDGVDFKTDAARKAMERVYINKNVLKITLPDFSASMRMTFAMLLQEMFRTIYPVNWQYLAVLSPKDVSIDGMLKYLNYDVENFPGEDFDIYIVEDSDIDMGLLESIEHNFSRFMELMTDYLTWHFEQLGEAPIDDPVEKREHSETEKEKGEKKAKRNSFKKRIASWVEKTTSVISDIFSRGKKKMEEPEGSEETEDEPIATEEPKGAKDEPVATEEPKGTKDEPVATEEPRETKGDPVATTVGSNDIKQEPISGNETGSSIISIPPESPSDEPNFKPDVRGTFSYSVGELKFIPPEVAEIEEIKLNNYGFGGEKTQKKDGDRPPVSIISTTQKIDWDNEKVDDGGIIIPAWDAPKGWKGNDVFGRLPKADYLGETGTDDEFCAAEGILDSFDNVRGLLRLPTTKYRKNCFLKFGFDEIDSVMALKEIKGYLTARGYGVAGFEEINTEAYTNPDSAKIEISDNALTNARNSDINDFNWLDDNTSEENRIYCDFCGIPLTGVSFEELRDGRVRCNDCSATAIETIDEFRRLFKFCFEQMQSCYRIHFDRPISVKMMDAKAIAKATNTVFKPTNKSDARVLGYAQHVGKKKFNLNIENGSPRLASIETMTHELTHIWQYIKWDERTFQKVHGNRRWRQIRTTVYEGMAVWSATQYLYVIGEVAYADLQEKLMAIQLERMTNLIIYLWSEWGGNHDDPVQSAEFMWDLVDPYAFGFYLYKKEFPLVRNMDLPRKTPFNDVPPFEDVMSVTFYRSIYYYILEQLGT